MDSNGTTILQQSNNWNTICGWNVEASEGLSIGTASLHWQC